MKLISLSILSLILMLSTSAEEKLETITLGAGCFWCVEAVFDQLDGVKSAESGYMGGHVKNPSYEQVVGKKSGHIEVVQVKFDPGKISLETVLDWFWRQHDPTTKDRQGADVGPQYASAIFYESEAQKSVVDKSIKEAQKGFKDPIVTQVREAAPFYVAEDYHQSYFKLNKNKNPYCRAVIAPKLKKLKLDH